MIKPINYHVSGKLTIPERYHTSLLYLYCIIAVMLHQCTLFPLRTQALDVLGSAVSCPSLQYWEVRDQIVKTRLSLALAAAQPTTGELYTMKQQPNTSVGEWAWNCLARFLCLRLYIKVYFCFPVVMEALHDAAFRNALSNSIYCPPHNVARLTNDIVSLCGDYYCECVWCVRLLLL